MRKRYYFFSKSWLFCSLFAAFIFLFSKNLKAQIAPPKQWDKSIGGLGGSGLTSLQQTSDGGYILGGSSYAGVSGDKTQPSQGNWDYWIVKVDASGNKTWDKTFGGNNEDYLTVLQQTSDGGYILGGYSKSGISGDKSQASKGYTDYWVVKVSASGIKMWDKTFGGSNSQQLRSLQQTSDGGYILGGYSGSGISGDKTQASKGGNDYWVLKLDANGNKTWDKTIGGSAFDNLQSLQQTSDGGYILGGESASGISGDKTQASKGDFDYWVVKLDANGNKTWDRTIGGNLADVFSSIQQTSDGGYILGGSSLSGIGADKSQALHGLGGYKDYWVVKLDAIGNKLWDKAFGGDNLELLRCLQQTSDGGYILGGESRSSIGGDVSEVNRGGVYSPDYWIVKLDTNGNKIWDKTLGGSAFDEFFSLDQTTDGGYILGGASQSNISGDKSQPTHCCADYWVVKLAPLCVEAPVATSGSNCSAGSVTLTASGAPSGGSYAWYSTPTGGVALYTNSSGTFTTPVLSTTTTFYVAAINNVGCEGPRIPVTATIGIPVNAGIPDIICATAAPFQLSGFSPTGGTWSGSGVSAGGVFTPSTSLLGNQILTYTVTQNGCTVSATKIVTVTSPPVANAGSPQIICATAASIQLIGFSPAGGTWSGPGVNAGGLFTPSNSLIGIQTLTYSITQNGCTVSSTKDITVTAPPIVSAGANEIICANASPVQLTRFSPAGGAWSGPGVSTSGVFSPNNNIVGYQTLTYSVTQNGCTVSTNKQVIVKPVYENFLGADTIVCEGQEITLRVTVPSSSYLWNDGSQSPFLKVKQSGKYWVQCTLDGCVFTDTVQVTFIKCPKLFIPNIITPNSDGKNDYFSPQYLPAGKWQIQIYNRWGVKLFESADYQNNWPDKKISDGTYYYLLRNPETGQQYKGWVEVAQ